MSWRSSGFFRRRRTPSLWERTTSARSKGIRSYILPPGTWHGVQVRARSGFTEASKLTASAVGAGVAGGGVGTAGSAGAGGAGAADWVGTADGLTRGAEGGGGSKGGSTVRHAPTLSSAKAAYGAPNALKRILARESRIPVERKASETSLPLPPLAPAPLASRTGRAPALDHPPDRRARPVERHGKDAAQDEPGEADAEHQPEERREQRDEHA